MAQCGVPTAAWPYATCDIDTENGLHWDNATNKFWVQPESNTNHQVGALSSIFAPSLGNYWRDKNGPFGNQKVVWWAESNRVLGQRAFFEIIRKQDSIMTVTNTSCKSRSISACVDFPQISHYVTMQSPWCALIGLLWYEIYPTSTGPTGAWVQAFGISQNVAFAHAAVTPFNNPLAVNYPWEPTYGGDTYGSGWITSSNQNPLYDGGGNGLVAKLEQMASLNWIGGVLPVGHSINMSYNVSAISPFNPLFTPFGVADAPWLASYTSIITSGVLNSVLI
jgi:hypothetical protein